MQSSLFPTTTSTLLLSLKEKYFNMILKGEKRYEYRKRFRKETVNAFIYLSSPRKALGGYIAFGKPLYQSVEEIAALYEREHGKGYQEMLEYFKGYAKAFALPINNVESFTPIPLNTLRELFPGFVAPQSYSVLDNYPNLLEFLEKRRQQA